MFCYLNWFLPILSLFPRGKWVSWSWKRVRIPASWLNTGCRHPRKNGYVIIYQVWCGRDGYFSHRSVYTGFSFLTFLLMRRSLIDFHFRLLYHCFWMQLFVFFFSFALYSAVRFLFFFFLDYIWLKLFKILALDLVCLVGAHVLATFWGSRGQLKFRRHWKPQLIYILCRMIRFSNWNDGRPRKSAYYLLSVYQTKRVPTTITRQSVAVLFKQFLRAF